MNSESDTKFPKVLNLFKRWHLGKMMKADIFNMPDTSPHEFFYEQGIIGRDNFNGSDITLYLEKLEDKLSKLDKR